MSWRYKAAGNGNTHTAYKYIKSVLQYATVLD